MSATPTTATEAPQQESQDFDAALDAYVSARTAPAAGEGSPAPVAVPAATAPAAEPARAEVPATPPATPAATESDDDDEALPLDQRFTRAQRREQRITQAQQAADQARQEAERKMWSYQGNLIQAQNRAKQLEGERDDLKRQTTDVDARENARWEAAIRTAPESSDDPAVLTRAQVQYHYDVDKRERALAAKEAAQSLKEKQSEEQATWQREQLRVQAESGMRQHAVSGIVDAIGPAIQELGLPATEVRDIIARLQSPETALLIQNLPAYDPDPQKMDVHKYRTFLATQVEQEIGRRKVAYEERQAATNRKQAAQAGTFRPEQPVGAAGGPAPGKSWEAMDADEAVDAWWSATGR